MKTILKLLLLVLIVLSNVKVASAQNILWDKKEYELQFVGVSSGNYINEYVLPSQTLQNWTNIITVHYFPSTPNPSDYIASYMAYVSESKSHYLISYMPDANLFSYGLVSQKGPYIEYNVLKAEKAKEGGIRVLQFGHKYKYKDEEGFKAALERSRKYNLKYVNLLQGMAFPEINKKPYEKPSK